MTDARRSSRSRKTVDYSAFEGDDNDDDFADPTPPTKKAKCANKENKLKRKKDDAIISVKNQASGSGNRQSLDDKLFDRDLEAALKLSIESQEVNNVIEAAIETPISVKSAASCVEPKASTDTGKTACLPSVAELDDEITTLSDESENPRKRRRAAKPVEYDDDDSDDKDAEEWNPTNCANVDSDNDADDTDEEGEDFDPDDSDSDYGSSKKKKGGKKTKAKAPTKRVTPAKPKAKANANVTPGPRSKPSSVKKSASKSVVKSSPVAPSQLTPTRVPTGGVRKAWVPPARTGSSGSPLSSLSVKSPTSGLRLGLSRNQKVKPLHPSVTS